jgi:hypothetical protein
MFSSVRIDNLFNVLDEINPELGEYFETLIKKNISMTTKLDASKSLREITKTTQEIPVGRFEPYADKATKAFFLPFYWVKNLFMNLKKFFTKKLHPQALSDEVRVNAKALRDRGLWNIYSQRLKEMQSSEMWKMPSTMSKEQRINALMKEVLHINGEAFRNEISGVKHTLLWLENEVKQFKKDFGTEDVDTIISKIMENKDNPDYQKYLGKIKGKLNRKSLDACARDKADYDTSVYSTANLFIGRLLSTMFLVFDTYNLTMLHSNNNRPKATENGANYAAQEINRTFISTYLIGLTNTIFRTFHNSSLWGALSLTALTNSSVQFLSRYSVGKPVTPKSQEELIEMDEKAKKANNPFLKIIAKGLGKNTRKIDYGQTQKHP